jgi:hypothetical protein
VDICTVGGLIRYSKTSQNNIIYNLYKEYKMGIQDADSKVVSIYDYKLKPPEEVAQADKLRLQKQKDEAKRKQDNDTVCRNYQLGKYRPSKTK